MPWDPVQSMRFTVMYDWSLATQKLPSAETNRARSPGRDMTTTRLPLDPPFSSQPPPLAT